MFQNPKISHGDSKVLRQIPDIEKLQPDSVLGKMKEFYNERLSGYMVEKNGETYLRTECSEEVHCYLCGCQNSSPFLKARGFCYVLCENCGLLYVNPRLRADLIEDFYKSEAYTYMFENMLVKSVEYRLENVTKKKIEDVKRFAKLKRPKLLDIGCGIGDFSFLAKKEGWQVEAVEFNSRAAAYARDNFDISVREENLEDCTFQKGQFDIVTMWGVLEHLLKPKDLLLQVRNYLKSEGILVVEVPSYDCLLVEYLKVYPERADRIVEGWSHIMLFSVPTLKRMLEEQGFKVEDVISLGLDVQTILRYVKQFDLKMTEDPLVQFLSDQHESLQEGLEKIHKADMIRIFARKV